MDSRRNIVDDFITVDIDNSLIKLCKKFAKQRIGGSSNLYRIRGEENFSKIEHDILVGALGEWAVFRYLNSRNYSVSEPDMEIYNKSGKSFSCDLNCDDKLVHVKSQSVQSVKRYGNSWLLQKHDPLVKNPSKKDYFALTNVDLDAKKVYLLGFIRCDKVDYGECKVFRYRRTKVALYFEDLNRRKFWRPKQK